MLKDITFSKPYEVSMHKRLWSEQELALSKCLWLKHDVEESVIIADLTTTTKVALLEFLKAAFSRVMEHPAEELFRNDLLKEIDARYDKMHALIAERYFPKLGYQDKLYHHQREACCQMVNKKINLLAYEMRTGKTKIAATLSKMLNLKRTVVICPDVMKWGWYWDLTDKITEFNELYFTILDSQKSKTLKAFQERFVVVNFEGIPKHFAYLTKEPIDHIIVDEAHYVKNFNSARFKNLKKLIDANPDARITLLTGSPIVNRVNDMFAYLKIAGHPLAENYSAFLRDFSLSSKGRGNQMKLTGVKNSSELWSKMSNFMLRKRQAECFDMPPKTFSKIFFELDDYKDEYEAAIKELLEKKDATNLDSSIHTANIVIAKSKISGLIEFVENMIEQGKKVCLYGSYKDPIHMLEAHFGDRCVVVDGSIDGHEKDRRKRMFTEDPNISVFIGNMKAAGIGINLSVSNDIIFMNFPLSPGDIVQSMMRLDDPKKKECVNVYYAMCKESIDEYLFELVAEKVADANAVVDNKLTDHSYVNVQDVLLKKLREQYNMPQEVIYGSEA